MFRRFKGEDENENQSKRPKVKEDYLEDWWKIQKGPEFLDATNYYLQNKSLLTGFFQVHTNLRLLSA